MGHPEKQNTDIAAHLICFCGLFRCCFSGEVAFERVEDVVVYVVVSLC